MKHRILTAGAVAALAGLAVVPGSVSAQQPAPAASVAGSYRLVQVDSVELPVQMAAATEGCVRQLTGATLTLTADNNYQLEATIRETCGDTAEDKTESEEGSYTVDGMTITFDLDDVPVDPAEPAAETIEFDLEDLASATVEEDRLEVKMDKQTRVLVFQK